MSEGLREYLLGICAAALLSSLALALCSELSVRRVVALCCGLLMAAGVLRPIGKFDDANLAQSIARTQMQAEKIRTGVEVKNRELVGQIIKQKTEAYILDKATSLGLTAQAQVTLAGEDVYPYPHAVTIYGRADAEQMQALSTYIEQEFAIPKERQAWGGS